MKTISRMVVAALSCVLMLFNVGCATIISGTKQNIHIKTTPSDATVKIGEQNVVPPTTVEVKKDGPKTVVISKDGFETKTIDVNIGMHPLFWLNIPCGALVLAPLYMAIDCRACGAFKLEPYDVEAVLTALPPGEHAKPRVSGISPQPHLTKDSILGGKADFAKSRICAIAHRNKIANSIRLKDGDETIGFMRDKSFLLWEREPGQVTITTTDMEQSKSVSFIAKAGETYYLELDIKGLVGAPVLELIDSNRGKIIWEDCTPTDVNDCVIY